MTTPRSRSIEFTRHVVAADDTSPEDNAFDSDLVPAVIKFPLLEKSLGTHRFQRALGKRTIPFQEAYRQWARWKRCVPRGMIFIFSGRGAAICLTPQKISHVVTTNANLVG